MAYQITNSRGNLAVTISDGATNTSDTSITLIGKNTTGYGQALNTNFYKLLENFASSSAPTNTVSGQLWYDTQQKTLKVYDEALADFKNIGTVTAGTSAPTTPTIGDTFYKTDTGALYVYDGSSSDLSGGWKLIGPQTATTIGISSGTILDSTSGSRSVTRILAGNANAAVLSTSSFTSGAGELDGLFATVIDGLNVYGNLRLNGTDTTITASYFTGTAENANKLGNIVATSYSLAGSGSGTTLTGETTLAGNLSIQGNIIPTTSNIYSLGNLTNRFTTVYAQASSALYADLAERFAADAVYEPGTVVRIGGTQEVTQENEELSTEVLGVVSTNPAFLMNDNQGEAPSLSGDLSVGYSLTGYDGSGGSTINPPIVIGGRAPVKVIGSITKGQRLVSAGDGKARGATPVEVTSFNVIGRSLEDKVTVEESTVMAIIKINT